MHPDRLAESQELAESCPGAVDRADLREQTESEWWGRYGSAAEAFRNLQMWRQVLAAYTQPLPDAAD